MKSIFNLFKKTFAEWSQDRASRLAAALAYYTIFSIAPLLVIVIGIAGLVWGRQAVKGQLMSQIGGTVGPQAASLIQTMVQNASKPSAGIAATIIGFVVLLFGASGVFAALQDALNTVWGVAPKPGRPLKNTLQDRLVSFLMVLLIGFLLLASLVISAALQAAAGLVGNAAGMSAATGVAANFLFFLVVGILLFALIFKILPDAEVGWSDVWIGATFTSLLFAVGRWLLGLYLGRAGVASTYGAAGSLVVLLLWIYYSAQILLLGAEFTQVYARRHGAHIRPAPNAIALTPEMRGQQGMLGGSKTGQGAAAEGREEQGAAVRNAFVASERIRARRRHPSAALRRSVIAVGGLALGVLAGAAQGSNRDKDKDKGKASSADRGQKDS